MFLLVIFSFFLHHYLLITLIPWIWPYSSHPCRSSGQWFNPENDLNDVAGLTDKPDGSHPCRASGQWFNPENDLNDVAGLTDK